MEIFVSRQNQERLNKLVWLGNYGDSEEEVAEYLLMRGIDDMLRSPGLQKLLLSKSKVQEGSDVK